MNSYPRRRFISNSIAASAGLTMAAILPRAQAAKGSPNNAVQLGIIGVGNKAMGHIGHLLGLKGVRIVALCDADQANLDKGQSKLRELGVQAKGYRDMRRLLDDPEVDAVVIATPNHWHALASIWACQAGKDVYVEKPVTHNLWEGKKIVEAARKYKRIVQAGTQNRSDTGFRQAIQYVREGNIGKVQWMHGLWYKERKSLGRVTGPQPIPEGVDYDLWTGPAPMEPLMRKKLHYDWHWDWDTGNGDMGNLGAHQLDDCVHALGVTTAPKRFLCLGGRYARSDDGETPNVQAAFFEFENAPPVIVELRGLPHETGGKYMDNQRGVRSGNIVQCENGYFAGGRGGGFIYDNDGKRMEKFPGDSGLTHFENWLEAIRTRKRSSLRAEIAQGARSADLCHLANSAFRSGLPTSTDDVAERVGLYEHATDAVQSIASHLKANDVDLQSAPLTCSQWMTFDSKQMAFSGGGDYGNAIANALVKPEYRAPFEVPQKV
ncbi:MAG: putative dehydrogenase [Candidatus Pelagisphaera sp.]|jgi:predicted dehydrogenase